MYQSQEYKWVTDYANIDYDESGKAIRIIGALQDITERKDISDNLYKNEIKYRSLLENMDFGILEVDTNDVILRAYPKFCEMLGYTENELTGKKANEMFLPSGQKEVFEKASKERVKGISHAYQIQLITKNKEILDVIISGTPLYNQQGKIYGSVGIHFNISDQKKIETELRESKALFETIFNNLSSPLFLLEPNTAKVIYANHAFLELLNKTQSEVVNNFITAAGINRDEYNQMNEILLAQNTIENYKLQIETNGKLIEYNLNGKTITLNNNKYYLIAL
jgi:PAS domain S-box-containing protein